MTGQLTCASPTTTTGTPNAPARRSSDALDGPPPVEQHVRARLRPGHDGHELRSAPRLALSTPAAATRSGRRARRSRESS